MDTYRIPRKTALPRASPAAAGADLQRQLRTAGFDEIEQFSGQGLLSHYVDGPIADEAPPDRGLVRAARFG